MDIEKFICFGDSHSRCFLDTSVKNVNAFSASSAKGLGSVKSLSNTNSKIRELVSKDKYDGYIFFFGKVDIDFILNHLYNTRPDIEFLEYIQNIVKNYIEFIKSLSITNVFICEIPISHMSDANLFKRINAKQEHYNINTHLDDKYQEVKYTKVIPYNIRLKHLLYFNEELKIQCESNYYKILEINKYFMTTAGGYYIPSKYINDDPQDHHLKNIGDLFIKSLLILT